MKLFIFILLTCSALNPALVYSSCEEAFSRLTSVQEEAQKSVWMVNSFYGSGTGFFIGPSIFVTNVHVVSEALLTLNGIDDITLTQEGNPLTLKVKAIKHLSIAYDLAVLEIEGKVSDHLNLKQGIPSPQENLSAIGYSKGNSQVIKKTGDIFDKSELDYTFPGNSSNNSGASGSPVLNTDGEVVGVYHAGNGNSLYAVKIIHLQNLLKQKVESFRSAKDHLEHSIKEVIEAADQGNVIAQYNLADFYRQGLGVKQDDKEAFNLYRQLAEQGYTPAQNSLAILYQNGSGVKRDHEKAVKWYAKATKQGNVIAQYNLAILHQKGLGVKQDHEKAFNLYRQLAEQGYAPAQNKLGSSYFSGNGVKQDFEKAIYWYKKAAEQGDANAQYNLGSSYYLGSGVKQDYEKAFDWFEKSAKQGDADAQFVLALLYQNGSGVKQDYQKAFDWYEKAAKQGNADAQINLRYLYEKWIRRKVRL